MTDPIARLLAELTKTTAPASRLALVAHYRVELDDLERAFVLIRSTEVDRARLAMLTWRQIGEALGVSLQRAHELGTNHPSSHQPTTTERTPQ